MSEKMGQLDIVFVVDNTGSMGPYIQNVKTKILEIIRTIKKEELCHRLRVGLVSYRDHPPEESTYVTKKFELSPETVLIEQNVMLMAASGGGDGPCPSLARRSATRSRGSVSWVLESMSRRR